MDLNTIEWPVRTNCILSIDMPQSFIPRTIMLTPCVLWAWRLFRTYLRGDWKKQLIKTETWIFFYLKYNYSLCYKSFLTLKKKITFLFIVIGFGRCRIKIKMANKCKMRQGKRSTTVQKNKAQNLLQRWVKLVSLRYTLLQIRTWTAADSTDM